MSKKIKKKADKTEELPEEETETGEEEGATKIGLKPGKGEDKEAEWEKVDAVIAKAKESFIDGGSTFSDVIDSLIATLQDMKEAKSGPMGGLGVNEPEMNLPAEGSEEQPEE